MESIDLECSCSPFECLVEFMSFYLGVADKWGGAATLTEQVWCVPLYLYVFKLAPLKDNIYLSLLVSPLR